MVAIRKSIISSNNRNYPKTLLNVGGLWITVHETGNTSAGANAKGEEAFMHSGGGSSSVAYHFAVDHIEAVQLMPLNIIGWHAGDGCDSRTQDVGCFASIAIETCVGSNNAYKTATRANLIELITAIISGDPRLNYNGTDPKRFSAERIAPHKRWSSYSKNCPNYMLNDGYFWTIQAQVIKKLGGVTTPTPKPDAPTYVAAKRIAELVPYASGDRDTIPASIKLSDGTPAFFVADTVKAIKDTPRLQLASSESESVGPNIPKGESFKVDWIFAADDGDLYYYTPWGTRVKVADTERVADGEAA